MKIKNPIKYVDGMKELKGPEGWDPEETKFAIQGTLIIAVNPKYPPKIYVSATNEWINLDIMGKKKVKPIKVHLLGTKKRTICNRYSGSLKVALESEIKNFPESEICSLCVDMRSRKGTVHENKK